MLPFQQIKGEVITLGARKRYMPGGIPGGSFTLLSPKQFGRVREKGDVPPSQS